MALTTMTVMRMVVEDDAVGDGDADIDDAKQMMRAARLRRKCAQKKSGGFAL